jgi:hypothetical protein
MTKAKLEELKDHCRRALPFECPSLLYGSDVMEVIEDLERYREALEALATMTNLPLAAAQVVTDARVEA